MTKEELEIVISDIIYTARRMETGSLPAAKEILSVFEEYVVFLD
jgi:hypothetical protein